MSEIQSLKSEIRSSTSDIQRLASKVDFWNKWNIVFIFLTFLAAGGLVVASDRLRNLNTRLASSQDSLRKAKDSLASLEIANTKLLAEQAKQRAEEEHLARVRIEEKLAGWKLDAGAQARIIKKLKPYEKVPFDLGATPTEVAFMETMDGILLAAGWSRQLPKEANPIVNILLDGKARINYVSGIYVEIASSRASNLGAPAKALIEALRAEGIPAQEQIAKNEPDASAIHLVIGSK